MWRIFNRLFGWHYVWVKDCNASHICRVRRLPSGELIGKIVSRNFFISLEGKITGAYNIQDWRPLTWSYKFDTSSGLPELLREQAE